MKNWKMTVLLILCIVLGVGLILYPGFSERWNKRHQSRAIAQYSAAVQEEDTAALEKIRIIRVLFHRNAPLIKLYSLCEARK